MNAANVAPTSGRVDYNGEKFDVVGGADGVVFLHNPGRNSDYGLVSRPVTEGDLSCDYQLIEVTINGRYYIHKGGKSVVYGLFECDGNRSLIRVHEFEVVSLSELGLLHTNPAV